ncbi:dioxygenase family protein [Roseicella aerolata]|uniref:Hydroxyquinol 1,2-dioxygenase n=1 Tax=Roseicella aerolata TaxID=2883479 RepID=A0A9X1ID21_9PROT|nr:dioxygenase [Roseicella aerolata]MCB4821986.1 hydroxyquinol 1,2-dioxygenase [Roseicella aerolata]
MPDLDRMGVTAEVLAQMAKTPDPRLRQIMEAATRHLHDFAREVELKPEEWLAGIAFLTAVGQACTPYRQEFILLSDVLGLSRLVNVMHDLEGREELGTETSLLGPFFREKAPEFAAGESIAREDKGGQEIILFGQVTDAAGRPLPGAEIDIWQVDATGLYDLQASDATVMDMRGRFRTDAEGRYHMRTVKPMGYSIPMDGPVGRLVQQQDRHGMRPGHIHILAQAPGCRELVTALYMADDPNIGTDTVFGVSRSLIVEPRLGLPGAPRSDLPAVRYDFRLSRLGAQDTGGRVGADPSQIMPAAR